MGIGAALEFVSSVSWTGSLLLGWSVQASVRIVMVPHPYQSKWQHQHPKRRGSEEVKIRNRRFVVG